MNSDEPRDRGPSSDSDGSPWEPWMESLMDRMKEDAKRVADGEMSQEAFHEKYDEERSRMLSEGAADRDPVPIDPDDPEWEEWAEGLLEETDYDTEFGIELARDARRVVEGSLSEAEFHERHHEKTIKEFGVDERPTKAAVESSRSGAADGPPLPGVPGTDGEHSRRSVLKSAGALGAAAVGISSVQQAGSVVAAQSDDDTMETDTRMGMAIDTERCIACLQCVEGCYEENGTAPESLWMYVFRYTEDHYTEAEHWLTRPCQHCSNAPCVNACPTASRYKRTEDGIVLTDYDTCTGCRYCEVTCPYGVNYLAWIGDDRGEHEFEHSRMIDGRRSAGNPPRGVMGKCTFCVHRQDSDDPDLQGTTACEDICPVDAIHFGDLEDEESAPRQHIQEKSDASTFKLLEHTGTEPNVIYIGNEPSVSAEPVRGPTTVEDIGRQKGRPGRQDVKMRYENDEEGDDDGY